MTKLFTIKTTPHLTAEQVSELIGRSARAVNHKRSELGVRCGQNIDPWVVGARPLLARSCPRCGLLLAAKWFAQQGTSRNFKGENWTANCRKCTASIHSERYPKLSRAGQSQETTRAIKRASYAALQRVSSDSAARHGHPYLASDHVVLKDADLSILEKAVTLGRTYAAVAHAVARNGYPSRRGLGDAEKDQWFIDNPNAVVA